MVAADTVYGVGELEMALRRAGRGYVLGVAATHHLHSWSRKLSVSGTAEEIAGALGASEWRRLSAGEGTKGARLYDWAYLELADLEAGEFNKALSGTWTRGLLVRRKLADGECAYFTTWCPAGTGIATLAAVEGRRWAIEDRRVRVPKDAGGDLGDAWTPVSGGAALTVGPAGFDYKLMARLLTPGEFSLPAAMEPPPSHRGDVWLQASVLVRGQGKTEGLHERWLPVPAATYRALRAGPQAETAGRLGKIMVANAGAARSALRLALLAFLQGGADKLDFKDERPREWLDRFEREVDAIFFGHLFGRLAAEDDARAEAAWRDALARLTRTVFDTATARLSPPDARRERAHAIAALSLGRMLNKAGLARAVQTEDTV